MKPFERNAANLIESLSFYGLATGRGRIEESGGVRLISSGVPYSVFNIALLTSPVADIEGELERRIHVAGTWFREQGLSWSFWICEDYLGRRTARRMHSVFDRQGLLCIAESPGMEAWPLPPPRRPLHALEWRRVDDAATRQAFTHLVSVSFQVPFSIAEQIYACEKAWTSSLEGYVGYIGGEPICSCGLVENECSVGIYSVSTLPPWRRKGYAESLMRQALATRPASTCVILQSSRAGQRLYYEMGFHRVTRWFVFATPSARP